MHRRRSVLSALALIVALVPFSAQVALASCIPGRADNDQHYWAGRIQSATATGVGSNIKVYQPYVREVWSWSWVMLANTSHDFQWAQIGPRQWFFGKQTSIQYAWSPTEIHEVNFSGYSDGSSPRFYTNYTPATDTFRFYVDGVQQHSVVISQWVPSRAEVSSEITTLASQMMGASAVNETFSSNRIQYGGGTFNFDGVWSGGFNSTYFSRSGSGFNFNVYDKACFT